jgi:hypothetical protein
MKEKTIVCIRKLQLLYDCRMYESHGCPGLVDHASLTAEHNIPDCTIVLNPNAKFPPTAATTTTEQTTLQAGDQGNTGNHNTLHDHEQGFSKTNLLMVHTSGGRPCQLVLLIYAVYLLRTTEISL